MPDMASRRRCRGLLAIARRLWLEDLGFEKLCFEEFGLL
jgi:hypothetical protein